MDKRRVGLWEPGTQRGEKTLQAVTYGAERIAQGVLESDAAWALRARRWLNERVPSGSYVDLRVN